jgi:hypothetical protein
MKKLSMAMLAALALVSFAGCKKKGSDDTTTAKLTEFKDRMCKCADKACADKVMEDVVKWGQEVAKAMENATPSEDDVKKRQAINEDMIKCQQKLISAAVPNPAAPPPPAAAPGDKPADTAAAPPPGDKPADTAAAPAGDKPAGGSN